MPQRARERLLKSPEFLCPWQSSPPPQVKWTKGAHDHKHAAQNNLQLTERRASPEAEALPGQCQGLVL